MSKNLKYPKLTKRQLKGLILNPKLPPDPTPTVTINKQTLPQHFSFVEEFVY